MSRRRFILQKVKRKLSPRVNVDWSAWDWVVCGMAFSPANCWPMSQDFNCAVVLLFLFLILIAGMNQNIKPCWA